MESPPQGGPWNASPRSGEEWAQFVQLGLTAADGGLRPHIDLDLGGTDAPDLEPALYGLLGVTDSSAVLMGICWLNTGDLEACRAEWGEPAYHVDLRGWAGSPLCWDLWRLTGATLVSESVVGPSLVLLEDDPRWLLYTGYEQANPMLYVTAGRCPVHQGDITAPAR